MNTFKNLRNLGYSSSVSKYVTKRIDKNKLSQQGQQGVQQLLSQVGQPGAISKKTLKKKFREMARSNDPRLSAIIRQKKIDKWKKNKSEFVSKAADAHTNFTTLGFGGGQRTMMKRYDCSERFTNKNFESSKGKLGFSDKCSNNYGKKYERNKKKPRNLKK